MTYKIKCYTVTHDNRLSDWCWHQVAKRFGRITLWTDFEVKTKAYAHKVCRELNTYCNYYYYVVVEK